MTKNRKVTCKEWQRVQRENRRTPFKSTTKLIELVDKRHYGDIVHLVKRLKPYLKDGERGAFVLTGLNFELEKLSKRQFVIDELAILLLKLKREDGLSCSQSVFIRYFSNPEHCNLGISEKSLKVMILEAIRRHR
jgi:hypothetical protein